MKKQNFKKVVALVAGSLAITLVVSIFPGNLLVNAAEISKREARKVALEYVNDDSAKIMVLNEEGLKYDEPFYTVKIKTDDREYEVEINANTKEVTLLSRDKVVAKPIKDIEDVENFDEFVDVVDKDIIEEKDYEAYGINKPTEEASLNQLLKEGKKLAIAEFKDSEDKEAFKEAKDFLKETKKDAKDIIKDEKKESTKVNDDVMDDKDDNDKLVEKVKISEKQALLIALKKINVTITDKQLNRLDVSDDYEKIFYDLDKIEIDLNDDKNPSIYEIELKYVGYEYKINVHATSGKILDYEKEDEDKDDKKAKSKVVEEKDKEDKENNGNNKDENGNNGKNKDQNKNKNK